MIESSLCRYADAYFAGHEHTLELHQQDCGPALGTASGIPLPQIVSGAAGKTREINNAFKTQQLIENPQLDTLFTAGHDLGLCLCHAGR